MGKWESRIEDTDRRGVLDRGRSKAPLSNLVQLLVQREWKR